MNGKELYSFQLQLMDIDAEYLNQCGDDIFVGFKSIESPILALVDEYDSCAEAINLATGVHRYF